MISILDELNLWDDDGVFARKQRSIKTELEFLLPTADDRVSLGSAGSSSSSMLSLTSVLDPIRHIKQEIDSNGNDNVITNGQPDQQRTSQQLTPQNNNNNNNNDPLALKLVARTGSYSVQTLTPPSSPETFLLVCNNNAKLRLINADTKLCRKVLPLPQVMQTFKVNQIT